MRPPHTLAEFSVLHPWPVQHGPRATLEYLWSFDVAAAPADLWRIVADTSRMNRALGTSPMTFTPEQGQLVGRSRPGGVRHEWIEEPWDWVAGQWMSNVRVYRRGFMRLVRGVQRVEPGPDGGARLYTYFGFVPRGWLGALAIRLGFPSLERDYRRLLAAIGAEAGAARPTALLAVAAELEEAAAGRLRAIAEILRGRHPEPGLVERLVDWIRTGDEQDLIRIQVRERALAWKVDEDAVLSLFLHATRAGLLDLSWDVVCPHCRAPSAEIDKAEAIPRQGSCAMCAIEFETDDAIEITFHVHPSICAIERRMFCSAEPAYKSHIRLQRRVAPGGEVALAPTLAPGRWRMRLAGQKRYGYLDADASGSASGEVIWRAGDEPRVVAVSPSPTIRLVNDGAAPVTFVVEASQWSDTALRPGHLLSFQEFRDLFSEEYLGSDVQLSVGEQTILFTDMVGSTALYAERGDPGAFIQVKRHFDELFAIVRRHRGAVVKTIGDAAMAAFNDPLDAVRASRDMHDAFPPGRADSLTRLRISLNTGPCIAVRLNANIDYFGGTVNVAAKLQSLAESWQIAMSCATWNAPGVAEWVRAQGGPVEDVAYTSKALPEPVPVKRWTLHEVAEPGTEGTKSRT